MDRTVTSTEFGNFTRVVDRVLTVSHEEIKRREAEYKKLADANPKKRGPKRKAKTTEVGGNVAAGPVHRADEGAVSGAEG